MSQQQWRAATDPSASSGNHGHPHRVSGSSAPEVRPVSTAQDTSLRDSGYGSGPISPRPDAPQGQMPMLPPLQRLPAMDVTAGDRKTTRPFGVHAILNTTQSEAMEPRGVRRSAAEMEAGNSEERQPPLPAVSSRPSSVESSYGDLPSPGMRGIPPRRILTPRSPTIQRVSSLGRFTGTIDAHQSPFLSPGSRSHTVEPGLQGVPPLPTPPAVPRARYEIPPAPSAVSTPPPHHRRASMGATAQTSGSTSPSLSYRQQGSMSPALPYPPPGFREEQMEGPRFPAYNEQGQPVHFETGGSSYIPISTSGQQGMQMLTINTNKGPVQIPTEVQAASRMADEKRKRNAGASARFRERRKLKEKESTQAISRLEQQVREASEDAEYYRRERDFFANLVYQAPGGDRHFPRPPSPRRGRLAGTPGSASGGGETASHSGSGSYSAFSEIGESQRPPPQGPPSEGRNTRRRTTGYSLPPPPAVSSIPHSSYVSAFAPIVPAPIGAPPSQDVHSPPLQNQPPSMRYMDGTGGHPSAYRPQPPNQPPTSIPRRGIDQPPASEPYDRSWTSGMPPSGGSGSTGPR